MLINESMNCPFFEEKHFRYCKALKRRVLIPSRTEKEELCCENYKDCPYYQEQYRERKEGACRLMAESDREDNIEGK